MLVLEHMLSMDQLMLSLEHCPSILDSVTIGHCPNRNTNPAITSLYLDRNVPVITTGAIFHICMMLLNRYINEFCNRSSTGNVGIPACAHPQKSRKLGKNIFWV